MGTLERRTTKRRTMKRRVSTLELVLVCALLGCVHTNAVRLGSESVQFPPVDAADVRVFQREADVQGSYDKVALINAQGDYNYANDERMVNAMKKRAGELGAD